MSLVSVILPAVAVALIAAGGVVVAFIVKNKLTGFKSDPAS